MSIFLINIAITTALCAGIILFFILKTKRIKRYYEEKQKEHTYSPRSLSGAEMSGAGAAGKSMEDMLSLVATKTDNYVMISDKDDRIEWVNDGFTRLTGYTAGEVTGKKAAEVLRGASTDTEDAERVDKKADNKKPYSAELLNYTKSGRPLWLFFNVTPILNEKGEIERYITLGSDITNRKKEEQELIRQKETIEGKYRNMWKTSLSVHKQKEVVENLNTELNEQKEKLDQAYKSMSAKNSKLWRTSLLVNKQKEEVEEIRAQLAAKNKDMTDSILYAKIIQQAILPRVSEIQKFLPEFFVLYKPKDIVSGDFYWWTLYGFSSNFKEREMIIAACDCTGHGVPGAFLSMIGNELLNNIIIEKGITEPAAILDRLQKGVSYTLKQDRADSEAHDGMDMALVSLKSNDSPNGSWALQYSGANNPLWIVRNPQGSQKLAGLEEIKPDKQPVGVYLKAIEPFTNHIIELQKGDTFYISSDGYQDQFGGSQGKKFKSRQFKQLLLSISAKSMKEQKEIIDNTFLKWKGELVQVDDILVIGVRV